ncbi:MAG: hypothetical protein ACI85K_001101 [Hyphomicrobiaceae bacterium]|jgi:hypothetical protein
MFTGLVQAMGTVTARTEVPGGLRLFVDVSALAGPFRIAGRAARRSHCPGPRRGGCVDEVCREHAQSARAGVDDLPGAGVTVEAGAAIAAVPCSCLRLVRAALLCLLFTPAAYAQGNWHQLPTQSWATQQVAFDLARERMVMFESSGQSEVSRTWEWVGDAWSLRHTEHSPTPRTDFSMAYDPVRQRMVMFGGRPHNMSTMWFTDTWEYDGVDWQQVSTVAHPSAGTLGTMAFDHVTNQMMFASLWSSTAVNVWLYDGVTWSVASMSLPGQSVLGSDSVRQRVVAVDYFGDTHEWDGSSWTVATPSTSAPIRSGERLAFVAQRGTVVMHGGIAAAGAAADMWEWDGTNWTVIAGTAPNRTLHSVAHDPVRDRMFVVGGFADPLLSRDTSQWDGNSWSSNHVTPIVGAARNAYFDENRQSVVAFPNGWGNVIAVEWDGTKWRDIALPANFPVSYGSAFDRVRQRAVLSTPQAVMEWDGVNWFTIPSATLIWSAAWHQGLGRVVGLAGNSVVEWDGVAWTQIATAPSGYGRLIYDEARDQIVLTNNAGLATWDGVAWAFHGFPGPPGHQEYGFAYDQARQRVVLFGGGYPNPQGPPWLLPVNDMWDWDGATWTQLTPSNVPSPRYYLRLIYDPQRQQMLALGGMQQAFNGGWLPMEDVWAFDANTPASIVTLGSGCSGTAPVPGLVASQPNPGALAFSLEVHGAPAGMPGVIALTNTPGNVSLGNGCSLFIPHQDQLRFVVTNAEGFASTHTAIPLALQGFMFAAQAVVLDASSPLGVLLTRGVSIQVGG